MRKSRRVFALLLTAILAFTCFTPDSSGVNLQNEQGSYPTFYEIFVYSFCDSDGDGVDHLEAGLFAGAGRGRHLADPHPSGHHLP